MGLNNHKPNNQKDGQQFGEKIMLLIFYNQL